MHCIMFSSLSFAGVEEEEDGVVAATETSDFCAGSLFALALALPWFPHCFCASTAASTTAHIFSTQRTPKRGQVANTAAAAVKTCVAVKNVVGMHVTYFSHVRRPVLKHRQHHRAHATPCTSTLSLRTKRVNNV